MTCIVRWEHFSGWRLWEITVREWEGQCVGRIKCIPFEKRSVIAANLGWKGGLGQFHFNKPPSFGFTSSCYTWAKPNTASHFQLVSEPQEGEWSTEKHTLLQRRSAGMPFAYRKSTNMSTKISSPSCWKLAHLCRYASINHATAPRCELI